MLTILIQVNKLLRSSWGTRVLLRSITFFVMQRCKTARYRCASFYLWCKDVKRWGLVAMMRRSTYFWQQVLIAFITSEVSWKTKREPQQGFGHLQYSACTSNSLRMTSIYSYYTVFSSLSRVKLSSSCWRSALMIIRLSSKFSNGPTCRLCSNECLCYRRSIVYVIVFLLMHMREIKAGNMTRVIHLYLHLALWLIIA